MQKRFTAFLGTKRGKTVASFFTVLVFVLSYLTAQTQPDGSFGLLARPTAGLPTATLRPPRTTPTATALTPTATASPNPPATATPTNGISPTPGSAHDIKQWHAPSAEPGFGHHHGVNPADYVDIFGEPLSDHLANYGAISYPWNTPDENSYFGYGHHTSYVWLYDQARNGCELFNNGGTLPVDTANCITDVLVQVHSDGTQKHLRKRFHSHYVFMRVCEQANGQPVEPCGTVATGGWVDYGILETPYKTAWCPLPGVDPATPADGWDLNQFPYRTSMTEYRPEKNLPLLFLEENRFWDVVALDPLPLMVQFWSGLRPNFINSAPYQIAYDPPQVYPANMPNYTVGLAWSSLDAWGRVDPVSCADPELDVFLAADGSSAWNNSAFQLFSVMLYQLPAPGPEVGMLRLWTNRWGLPVEGCVNASVDCVPLLIGAGVPNGMAIFNRPVQQGDPTAAPILEFDPGGGVILPAPLAEP